MSWEAPFQLSVNLSAVLCSAQRLSLAIIALVRAAVRRLFCHDRRSWSRHLGAWSAYRYRDEEGWQKMWFYVGSAPFAPDLGRTSRSRLLFRVRCLPCSSRASILLRQEAWHSCIYQPSQGLRAWIVMENNFAFVWFMRT